MTKSIPDDQLMLERYRQSWEQARHNETLRTGFSGLMLIAASVVIGFMAQTRGGLTGSPWPWLLVTLLMVLGFLVTMRSTVNAERWIAARREMEPGTVDPPRSRWPSLSQLFLLSFGAAAVVAAGVLGYLIVIEDW